MADGLGLVAQAVVDRNGRVAKALPVEAPLLANRLNYRQMPNNGADDDDDIPMMNIDPERPVNQVVPEHQVVVLVEEAKDDAKDEEGGENDMEEDLNSLVDRIQAVSESTEIIQPLSLSPQR